MTAIKKFFLSLINSLSACMQPVIPVIIAAGLTKLILLLMDIGSLFSASSQTRELLQIISDAPFYFLPIAVAYASAKHFKVEPIYAIVVAGVLLLPDFVQLMDTANAVHFIVFPVVKVTYAYSVIPIIIIVYAMSLIIKLLEKIVPPSAQQLVNPLFIILLSSLAGILIVGPIGALLGNGISIVVNSLFLLSPAVACAVLGFLLPAMICTGLQWVFLSVTIPLLASGNIDPFFMSTAFNVNMALSAASLVTFMKCKAAEAKKNALSAGVTVFITGVSEPALFGVCVPYKTPLLFTMIAAGVAGIFQGIALVQCYVFAIPGVLAFLMFSNPSSPANLINALISGAIAFVVCFLLMLMFFNANSVSSHTHSAKKLSKELSKSRKA